MGTRLLLLACSQRKRSDGGLLPALMRYDGPAFRVLRKYLRERSADEARPGEGLKVLVLSAKFGLMQADRAIPDYDVRMTPSRARSLRTQAVAVFAEMIAARRWEAVALCLGADYEPALAGFKAMVPAGVRVVRLGGGLGPRLTALRDWLREPASAQC